MASIDLQACEGVLREAYLRGRRAAEQANPGMSLRVTATHRTVQEQRALYAKGRTTPGQIITHADGVRKMSNHNFYPSRAIDFCVTWGGKVSWKEEDYELVGPYMEAEGLEWGGRWKSIKDLPHVELPEVPPSGA